MNIFTLWKLELNMNTDVGSWICPEMLARTTACGLWGAEKYAVRRMKHRDLGEIHRCSSQCKLSLWRKILFRTKVPVVILKTAKLGITCLESFLIYAVTTDKVKTFIQNPWKMKFWSYLVHLSIRSHTTYICINKWMILQNKLAAEVHCIDSNSQI